MNFRHDDSSASATAIAHLAENFPGPILVVDDSESIRRLLARMLRFSGYRVLEAEDGLAARPILDLERPALIITDLNMPAGNGWDLLAYCHAHYPEIPVVLASGTAPGQRPEIECHAASIVPKPFTLSRLRREVRRLLSPRRQHAA